MIGASGSISCPKSPSLAFGPTSCSSDSEMTSTDLHHGCWLTASHEEGFSNAFVEKFAAGLPVVATRPRSQECPAVASSRDAHSMVRNTIRQDVGVRVNEDTNTAI
jgi:hypothetical protein